jgi:GT2 family glycosyltransferase
MALSTALPDPEDPALSVVMVTHGAWPLTQRAIEALITHTERSFELIVVDNDSRDETRARLLALPNARTILNDENEGFGPATNRGAALARAERLLLLNTDAFVQRGWLEPLFEALEAPGVGAVVPRYLHPDGSLQDAGALLARDGTVLVYGDGDDPSRGCYGFPRVVDSGAAACMLIRRDLFHALDGFDPIYAPAYYEDADLCLRIAEQDWTVVYEPRSAVTHQRYGSAGLDRAAQLSRINRRVFVERWGPRLVGRPRTFHGTTEQAVIAARDARATPRVLICARPRERIAERVARQVARNWPRARVTWATGADSGTEFEAGALFALGVELLDDTDLSWLTSRLFHYDIVLLGNEVDSALLSALGRAQPQATWIALSELDHSSEALPTELVSVMALAGIAPAADGARG